MVVRALDIVFQNLKVMATVLAAVPLLVAAGAAFLDRSEVVTTRLWADRPLRVLELNGLPQLDTSSPAATQTVVLSELVASDSFVDQVLTKSDPGYSSLDGGTKAGERKLVRQDLSVVASGANVMIITYKARSETVGVSFLNSLTAAFGQAIQSYELNQAAEAASTTAADQRQAQADLGQAAARLQGYIDQYPNRDLAELQADPAYQTLRADLQEKSKRYQALKSRADDLALGQSTAQLQNRLVHVLDQPRVEVHALGLSSSTLKLAGLSLAVILLAELTFVYVMARRDPRVRSSRDVERLGLRGLGSVPILRSPAR
jgi:hypothetical protein